MKKVRYVLPLILVLLVTFALVGCGGDKDAKKEEPAAPDQTEASKIEYPTKPIEYMIPFDAGGQSDIEARRQQPLLKEYLGQPITVTYKPGGGGAVGWAELVHKKPDGYYMGGFNIPHIMLQPMSRADAGYKTEQIEPVAIFQKTYIGLAVQKDSPYNTLEEYIEAAKAKPNSITVGGSGTFSGHHLAYLLLDQLAGIQTQFVPFTGAAPQLQAFLGGHINAMMGNSNDLVAHYDDMKVLAIASEERFEALPDVPTFKELGYDFDCSIDRGVAVPPGTDPAIIEILEEAFLKISNDPEIQAQMLKDGFTPVAMGAADSKKYIEEKTVLFAEIMKDVEVEEKK